MGTVGGQDQRGGVEGGVAGFGAGAGVGCAEDEECRSSCGVWDGDE